jgi:hypothetical protein
MTPLIRATEDQILHYRQLYIDRPEPIVFMTVVVDTSGHIYDDGLRAACLANIKGSVGLILAKVSVMRISIPLDLSSMPFILGCLFSSVFCLSGT